MPGSDTVVAIHHATCKPLAKVPFAREHQSCYQYKVVFKVMLQCWEQGKAGRSAIAGLAVALFLIPLCLSTFETMHSALHEDSHDSDHDCAVALFEEGLLDAADPVVHASAPSVVPACEVCWQERFFASAGYRLPACRAPPINV